MCSHHMAAVTLPSSTVSSSLSPPTNQALTPLLIMGSNDFSPATDSPRTLLFGQYELGRVLGQGSFAKVYLSRDVRTNNTFAIKVINKDLVRQHPGLAAQINNEIAAMHLLRHPYVVSIHQVMATKTRIFVVMDYVGGGELFARVAAGRLPEPVARHYFQQLISAVDFCHSRGVSHRDLKPENLLLDEEGNLKISDFGLSALPEQRRADGLLHTQCGTPAYVAPEVLRRKGYDGAKADLWSCGVILFVLLAGHLPFPQENLMKMYCKVFKAEYATPPWFSASARRLISRLLVVDPQRRISIAALKQIPWFKKGLTIPPPPLPPPPAASATEEKVSSPRSYNAFELISSMSSGFDLSGLFVAERRGREIFTTRRPAAAVMAALESVGRVLGFGVERGKGYEVKMEGRAEGRKGRLAITAEVFEVAAEVAVVEFCKVSGDTMEYAKFWEEDVRPALKDIVWAWHGENPSNSGDKEI